MAHPRPRKKAAAAPWHAWPPLSVILSLPIDMKLQPLQLVPQDSQLRAQIANERRVAKGVVCLPRAHDHALHLVDEALDDDPPVLLVRARGEMDGKLAAQLEGVTCLAPCRPCRFEDGGRALPRQSYLCCGRPWAACDRTQGGKDVPSCKARHLRVSRGQLPYPALRNISRHLRQNNDRHAARRPKASCATVPRKAISETECQSHALDRRRRVAQSNRTILEFRARARHTDRDLRSRHFVRASVAGSMHGEAQARA
jgi:hypothetical protein